MIRRRRKGQKGQAMVEYIIVVVVVALAAFAILGAFSDRIRSMITGATVTLGGEAHESADTSSVEISRGLNNEGLDDLD
jgi:Flp pilus assembly pilin Flp